MNNYTSIVKYNRLYLINKKGGELNIMANKMNTPNFNKWVKKFGRSASEIASETLRNIAPGMTTTADAGIDAIRESREFISRSKSKMQQQAKDLMGTNIGKDAQNVLNSAFSDIKNGTFSLNKLSDETFDSLDDIESSLNYSDSSSDTAMINDSKKSMAIIGRTVTEGNVATIEGMKHMTSTLSSIQIKSSNAVASKLTNVALVGINQTSTQLAGVNNRLDAINSNIITMMDFQRENVARTNQATLEYYSQSSQMLNEMGKALTSIQDFIESTKKMNKSKPNMFGSDSFESGFSLSGYKDLVKKNFNNSIFGMASMIPSMLSMTGSMGMSPFDLFKGDLYSTLFVPKNIKKSIARMDKMFTSSIDEVLYRIGDMQYGTDLFGSIIGELLGKKRPKVTNANLGNFKKDYMGWNGIAQKTLVEVIPSYLSRIESALTKRDERYYNSNNGRFMTTKEIEKDYYSRYSNTMEYGMTSFKDALNEAFEKGNVDKKDKNEIKKYINEIVNDQLSSRTLSTKNARQGVYDKLKNYVSPNDLRELMMEYNSSLQSTMNSIQSFINSMEDDESGAIYRNLFNQGNSKQIISGDIFNDSRFNRNGIAFDLLTEDEKRQAELDEEFENKFKEIKNKYFKNKNKVKATDKISNRIDRVSNKMFDMMNDLSFEKKTSNTKSNSTYQESSERKLNQLIQSNTEKNLNSTLLLTSNDISRDSAEINKVVDDVLNEETTEAGNIPSSSSNESRGIKALLLSLHSNFLKPMVGGIFGKDGFVNKIFSGNKLNEIKKKLFDDDDSIFKSVGDHFKDAADYMKHIFTGKGYKKRTGDGESIADTDDSVLSHLKNGYDFVFKNTMKYLFGGENFKDNETYQKYFSFLDFKGRKEKKNQESLNDIETDNKESSKIKKSVINHQKMISAKFNTKSSNAKTASDVIMDSSVEASEIITSSAKKMSESVLGTDEGLKKAEESSNKSITSKIKSHLPKTVAVGLGGALFGGSVGIHGAGILGSLFLPGGPIGGAIAAIGMSIIAKSSKFQEFMFGKEDDNGNKTGGLISKKTQDFFKKNLPTIVGGTALGAISGLFKSAVGIGNGGFLLSSLLPGGPIGGALLSFGFAILKNNEKFNKILFGEKGEDNKHSGGIFSGGMNKMTSIMEKSGEFIKGGLKGLGAGALTGLTLSKFGIIGSALSMGGPVGMGLAGLGIGIASQTKKFQELLFGTEEFDENGNLKGRYGNGLLTKVRNMMVINIFEPVKDEIQNKMTDFAFWAKENIMFPFREAFGPILESLKGIQKDISDTIHDAFHNMAESVGNLLKKTIHKVFSPLTSMVGKVTKFTVGAVANLTKLSLAPVSGALKVAKFATRHKRRQAAGEEKRTMFEHAGDIIRGVQNDVWENDERDYGKGPLGSINKLLTRGRDLSRGFIAAEMAYEDGLGVTGQNRLDYLGVKRERRQLSIDKKNEKDNRRAWKKIDKYRSQLMRENDYAEARYSDEELAKIQRKFQKYGINKDWIKDNESLNLLLSDKSAFKSKFDPNRSAKSIEEMARTDGLKIRDTSEQLKAMRDTKSYQEYMMTTFSSINKKFTQLGIEQGIKSKTNLNISDMTKLNAELKANGLTWKDIGVNPRELLNQGSLSESQYAKVLSYKDAGKSENDAIIDILNDVKESTQTSAALDINEASIETGATISDIAKATGRKNISPKVLRLANAQKRLKAKIARDQREADESKSATAGTDSLSDSTNTSDEAIIENETEKNKDTVFSSIGGFFKNMLGTVAGWFTSTGFWKSVGIATIAAGFIGPKTKEFLGKVWNTVTPFIGNALSWVSNVIVEKGPALMEAFTQNIINNMGSIISNSAKILWSGIETTAKMLTNALSQKVFGKDFFVIGGKENETKTKIYDSYEEAKLEADKTGENVYTDQETGQSMILGNRSYINEEGKEKTLGDTGFKQDLAREAVLFSTSSFNRKITKASAKLIGKGTAAIAGGITKKVSKPIFTLGKGAITISKTAKNLITGNKTIGEAVIDKAEDTLEKNAAKAAAETAKYVVTDSNAAKKGILKWIDKASSGIKKLTNILKGKISATKFGKVIDTFFSKIATKISSMSDKNLLKKLYNKILKKTGETSAKTAAGMSPLAIAFMAYGAINGAMDAAYLFGVNDNDVTARMRIVSSIMETLFNTSFGGWFALALDIYDMIFGTNSKRYFATNLYSVLGGDKDELEEAATRLELECKKYNEINNTNLTTDAYNNLSNSNKSIWGRIKQGASWVSSKVTGNSAKYDAKYNFSKYSVSDEEVAAYRNTQNNSNETSTSSYDYDSNLFYGSGSRKVKTKSVGYGNFYLQNDNRWADYSLGKFPDGSNSTMATGGCGPTALSMVANQLGTNASPLAVASYAKQNGFIKDGGATANLFTNGASEMGINSTKISKSGLNKTLEKGDPIVLAGKSDSSTSPYTSSGHVVMVSGLDSNGNAIVNDPMRGKTSIPVNKLTSGMTHGWKYSKSVGYGNKTFSVNNYNLNSNNKTHTEDGLAGISKIISNPVQNITNSNNTPKYNQGYSSRSTYSTGSLKTKKYILKGYQQNSDGVLNWNNPKYYSGLTVGDIKVFAATDNALLTNSEIPLFAAVYNYYALSGNTENNKAVSVATVTIIKSNLDIPDMLGGNGTENGYNYKNGFPFFNTNDSRWSNISWRGGKVKSLGSDLSSLAMIASAYGSNIISPSYIYNHWLQEYPSWWSKTNGIAAQNVYKDGGFNAMKSTQVDGQRLKISNSLTSKNSIMSKLKSRIPVVLSGYRYNGSIFGGDTDKNNISVSDKKSMSTVVALYGQNGQIIVNDPYTGLSDNSLFSSDLLGDTVANNRKAVISAYAISDPSGKGLSDKVNMSKSSDSSTFKSTKGLSGVDKISAIFSNIVGIANNMISSLIDGTEYKSIMSDGELENDGADDTGVGQAVINETATPISSSSTTHESSSGTTHGGQGGSYTTKNSIGVLNSDNLSFGGGRKDLPIGYGFDDIINKIGAISYASQAQLLGQDYQTAKQEYYNSQSSDGTNSGAGNVNVSVSGNDNKEKIWSFLTGGAGLTANAASGIMGCWQAESHNDPTVVEGYYLKNYPGFENVTSSESAMDNYCTGVLFPAYKNSGMNINQNGYKADGHYYPGFGLAQWTGPRAKQLKEYAASKGKDWRNLEGQLDYFYNYNGEFMSKAGLKEKMNAATSPEDAATLFLDHYEMNDPSWHTKSTGAKQNSVRRANARSIYNLLTSKNTSTPSNNQGISSIGNGIGKNKKARAIGYGYSWLEIVQAVKQAIAARKLGYSQSRYIELNVLGQTINNVRTDCSGFVSACLRLYGSITTNYNSSSLTGINTLSGFTKCGWNGWESLQPGDIIAKNGHVEIFAKNENGTHYVFNCGSDSSCNNPGMTSSSKPSYTTVWRPGEAGTISNTFSAAGVTSLSNNTMNSTASPFDSIFNSIESGMNATLNNVGFGQGPKSDAEKYFSQTLGGQITSGYGNRKSSLGSEYHRGIDIASRKGTPVKSPINGKIVSIGNDVAGYGNYAVVQDGKGNNHIFAHMNKSAGYGVGSIISKNDIIGEVGSTGRSTGDHLHYEIRKNGNKYSTINPSEYKYDSIISKNLNINTHNTSSNAIGGGNKDINTNMTDKLTVALETDNVETKLDSLISVMKTWAERDAEKQKQIQNINQNNNTTTVVYGSGKDKKVVRKKSTSTNDLSSKNLAKIHKSIASKVG